MGRGSTKILLRKVINSLGNGRKSITEIAKDTELDRTAIARYLSLLKDSEILDESEEGTKKVYSLKPNYRSDIFFGLPVNSKDIEKIESLYAAIKSKWKSYTQKKLLKTHAQKIIYKVINICNLKLPIGWYVYGGICVVPFDDSKSYKQANLSKAELDCVSEVTKEFSKHDFAWQSKQTQYEEEGNVLYSVKERILSLLYSKNFKKNSMYIFQKEYNNLIINAPKLEDSNYSQLLNKYNSMIIDITKNWESVVNERDDLAFGKFKQVLTNSFEALWKLIALVNFKNDLQSRNFFPKQVLDSHFKLDIVQQEQELEEMCSELQEAISNS